MQAVRALVITTADWPSTAKLAIAMAKSGFSTAAVAGADHPITTVGSVARHFPLRPRAPLATIRDAIETWEPDLLVPCDDAAVRYLHAIFAQARGGEWRKAERVRDLIATSLGDPAGFPVTESRSAFSKLACGGKSAMPETLLVSSAEDLGVKLATATFPLVLKADGTFGGKGVAVVGNRDEAERKFRELTGPPSWLRSVKRAIQTMSVLPMEERLLHVTPAITMQRYIHGEPANRAVACWRGEVIAGMSAVALRLAHENGPATVVRMIDHPEMAEIAARFVRELRISGFCGFDFIVEAGTDRAYLLEMNARATPICHLSEEKGGDLIGALLEKLTGAPRRASVPAPNKEVVALFPNEFWRDPRSEFLTSAFHDVPWEEPDFVRACAVRPRPGWFGWRHYSAAADFPANPARSESRS